MPPLIISPLPLPSPLSPRPPPPNSKMSRSNRMVSSKRWDSYEDVPLTQSFESGSQQEDGARLSRNSEGQADDLSAREDGDRRESNINVAVIVVSSRRINIEEVKKSCLWVKDYLEIEEQESPNSNPLNEPVEEDLYKIPPELLFSKPKKKTGLCLLSSCLLPACAF